MHQAQLCTPEFEAPVEMTYISTRQLFTKKLPFFARQIRSGLSNSLSQVDLYQRASLSGNSPVPIVIRKVRMTICVFVCRVFHQIQDLVSAFCPTFPSDFRKFTLKIAPAKRPFLVQGTPRDSTSIPEAHCHVQC